MAAKTPKPDDVVLTLVERVDAVEKAVRALQHEQRTRLGYDWAVPPDAPEPPADAEDASDAGAP
jgi:hypothetical protein